MIVNLTQHPASAEQVMAGVCDLPDLERAAVKRLLTFPHLPSSEGIHARADEIAAIANVHGAATAMIGGAPYLMAALERALMR